MEKSHYRSHPPPATMENANNAESGEESIDSIPRPEYEAVEAGVTSSPASPGIDPLRVTNVQNVPAGGGMRSGTFGAPEDDGDMQSEDTFSKKSDITEQDFRDLDSSEELVIREEIEKAAPAKNCKRYRYEDALAAASKECHSLQIHNEPKTAPQTQATCSSHKHQLVQAKTKDNTFLLVQLVDDKGKTFTPVAAATSAAACNATAPDKADVPTLTIGKTNAISNHSQLACSSPPLSREFLALQKSVNESKVLKKFVTDITVEKARKRKTATKNISNKTYPKAPPDCESVKQNSKSVGAGMGMMPENWPNTLVTDGSALAQSLLQQSHLPIDRLDHHTNTPPTNSTESHRGPVTWAPSHNSIQTIQYSVVHKKSAEKTRKSAASKFVPLKDEASALQSAETAEALSKRRSRSKSFSRKLPDDPEFQSNVCKVKRWPSEENQFKRTNMRSQNSEFVKKQIDFLDNVKRQGDDVHKGDDYNDMDDEDASDKRVQHSLTAAAAAEVDETEAPAALSAIDSSTNDGATSFLGHFGGTGSDRGTPLSQISGAVGQAGGNQPNGTLEKYLESICQPPPKRGSDSFCWKCHQCLDLLPCAKCVRSFHPSCIKITAATKLDKNWTCPECVAVESVLTGPKRTRRNDLSLDLLSQLLSFALKRMRNVKGLPQFVQSGEVITSLPNIFVNPVTLETLQEKIDKRAFRCSEEFVNETKWMHHNALIVAGGSNSKDILTAKAILKVCRQETNEIETCPECYLNANTRSDWFVDVCSQPHLLLWAKLKGFPYWPAKAMGLGQGAHVNVRFFGEHDRAFVPSKDCYLFSEQVPNSQSGKRSSRAGFAECIQEVEVHIERIRTKIGAFEYAPYKTLYDPGMELAQLELMMPGVQEYMRRQQSTAPTKPPLQYKIVKTADNNLSIIKKGTSTADSGTESDHSLGMTSMVVPGGLAGGFAGGVATATATMPTAPASSHGKRKLQEHNDHLVGADNPSKTIKNTPTTSNYEVISKIDDESNSSKVNTVILKRKSEYGAEQRKAAGDAVSDSEFPLPKMTKIEEDSVEEEERSAAVVKCKALEENDSKKEKTEAVKKGQPSLHSNADQKIPVLTIKTNGNKVVEHKETTDAKAAKPTELPNTSKTMESLVKYKQGVTIKKITKDEIKKKQTERVVSPEKSPKEKTTKSQQNVEHAKMVKEKAQADAKSSHKPEQPEGKRRILIDLIPFVEIKKEIASDDENAVANSTIDSTTNTAIATAAIVPTVATETLKPLPTASTPSGASNKPTAPPQPPPQPRADADVDNLLLVSVKNEVLSDEEAAAETATTPSNSRDFNKLPAELPPPAPTALVTNASTAPVTALAAESVRVVGGTTIQRVATKSATTTTNSIIQAPLPAAQSQVLSPAVTATSPPLTGSIYSGLTHITSTAIGVHVPKRGSARGIPYGPLPATAAAAAAATATATVRAPNAQSEAIVNMPEKPTILQQQQKLRPDQQRARKSFPNRSPTEVSPIRGGGTSTPPSPATPSISTAPNSGGGGGGVVVDPKRTLSKTSMVSIPVDIAANRCSSSAIIPVPPLTAVTKVAPTYGVGLNTMPGSTVGVPMPMPTPTFINCNGSMSASVAPSAPPPLAGLSYNTFTSSTAMTATTATMTSTSGSLMLNGIASGSPLAAGTGTVCAVSNHVVDPLGISDFVTPAMASTITEVMCRGPPRMLPRPNGPLQSEGSTMFPSQAGPVCRTLVENAHKLTDFFISVMEDTMSEMSLDPEPVLQAKITLLTLELERTKQTYEREVAELRRTSDLMLCEMRKSMENEKSRIAAEVRKQCELERKRSIEETKKKQWCANCGRESQFHCCWNTSYCDYPCQQQHWSRHAASCAQTRPSATEAAGPHNVAGNASSHQMDRHHVSSKSMTTITTSTSAHYNNKSVSKKEKSGPSKGGSTVVVSSNAVSVANATPTEILKLPTNTYLRPVGSSANVRLPYSAQASVQRFNIPLPIPAPANPGPYTLVQREGNWELMSAATTKSTQVMTGVTTVAANPLQATVATSHHHYQQSQQQQQQTRLLPNAGTLSTKSPARARGGNNLNAASVALQPVGGGAHLSGSLQCSGAVRPNQI